MTGGQAVVHVDPGGLDDDVDLPPHHHVSLVSRIAFVEDLFTRTKQFLRKKTGKLPKFTVSEPRNYATLVVELGWTLEEYERWLISIIDRLIVAED